MSDLDYRAYFYGEELPTCVDCDSETTLTDPHDRAARCAPCQEKEMERRSRIEQEEPSFTGGAGEAFDRRV